MLVLLLLILSFHQVHRHSENNPTWPRQQPHHLECITSSIRPPPPPPPRGRVSQRAGVQAGRQFSSALLGSMRAICQLWRTPGGGAREVEQVKSSA